MTSSRMFPRLQGEMAAPHNPKLGREAEKPKSLTLSALRKVTLGTKKKLAGTLRKFNRPTLAQFLDTEETSQEEVSTVEPDKAVIEAYPPEVVFNDNVPGKVHETIVILRNTKKTPEVVRITMESSPYFQLVGPSGVYRQIPANGFSTVKIVFTSEGTKDHFHELVCTTGRERIIVPIRAIGPRPALDFPKRLDFSKCLVNSTTQKTLLIRNVGDLEARYHISAPSPFSVVPTRGTLNVGEAMQVTLEFRPRETGRYAKTLVVHCERGEDTRTILLGKAVNVNIGLDKYSVKFESTYLTLSNHETVIIHNRSNSTARFQWKSFASEQDDNEQKLRLCHGLSRPIEDMVEDLTKKRYKRLAHFSRMYETQIAKVQADPMLFSHDAFSIEPLEGEIGPNCSAEINVFFNPQEVQVYEKVAYCDISGRENRLPLRITGEGLGPSLQFNLEVLDIGKVFAGAVYKYEAILFNKGAIDAPFELVPPTTEQSSHFTFQPQKGTIAPNGLQPIEITFSSMTMAPFKEEFQFNVIGSPKPVTLTVRGCVTGLSLHFNIDGLHFGDVSFGFPQTLSCRLTNTSVVPITFRLRIPEDGTGQPSFTSFDQVKDNSHPSWVKGTLSQCPVEPVEFTITPSTATIPAGGSQEIKVTLCSNYVGKYNYQMLVDVDDVAEEVLAVPIKARCVVPELRLLNTTLNFGKCDLKVPYQDTLTIVNGSPLPGCYGVLPQKCQATAPLWYSSPEPCGIVEPYSTAKIPITIEAQALGDHSILGDIAVFGRERIPLNMRLMCNGQPPLVYISVNKVDFGNIQVLKDTSQTLQLCNLGIVPAAFRIELGGRCWRIEPRTGVIPPKSEVPVTVTANLDDMKKFEDEAKVFIEDRLLNIMPVQAVGIGTTIVIDEPFAPELRLGPQYSLVPCILRFKVTNKGQQFHRLYWGTEGFSAFRQRHPLPALSVPKGKNGSQRPKSATPIFKLRPLRMDLMPGQSAELILQGFSSIVQEVKEKLVCHAAVGPNITKEKIIETEVTCTFISPVVQISATEISFRVEKYPSDVLTTQYKPLTLKNTCVLPFSVLLDLEQPFLVCDAERQPIPAQPLQVMVGEELHLCIGFNTAYEQEPKSWAAKKTMRIRFVEHPHEEEITIRGEVYFPNLHIPSKALDFGCVLTDTEQVRHLKMTNCSPIPASYSWSFQVDIEEYPTGLIPFQPVFKPPPPMGRISCFECVPYSRSCSTSETLPETPSTQESLQGSDLQSFSTYTTDEDFQSLEEMEWQPVVESKRTAFRPEEIFDVLPSSGVLQPGETRQVPFTFFAHANIVARVTALCSVDGGPTYTVDLAGEASGITYNLSIQEIDCGLQLFSEVTKVEVTLQNKGKIGFTYTVQSPSTDTEDSPLPGVTMVMPNTGYIGPGKEQVLKLYYLPGLPGAFCMIFQLQVGHLKPAEITLKGEAVFPRIALDLPWNIKGGNKKYKKVLKKLKEKLEKEGNETTVLGKALTMESPTDDCITLSDTWLKMEMEQILMTESALKLQGFLTSHPAEDTIFDKQIPQKLVKVELPEHFLDMGTVVLGCAETRIVRITNPGQFPVSFRADDRVLDDTGFSVDLEPVEFLTFCNSKTLQVHFESTNLAVGEVEVVLPIKITRGPTLHIRLHATVIQRSLSISRNRVQFSEVQVGQCQTETVRLYNRVKVPCYWSITVSKPAKKADKQQKKPQAVKAEPCAFSMEVWEGVLLGEAWCDLNIRFSPMEEKSYKNDLKINLRESTQCLLLHLSGHGLEPRLEFNPTELKMGAVLPCSPGLERTVVVKNPCKFPVEFYSLEFDEEYREEEKILQQLNSFRYQTIVLMPPRAAGEKLPPEVLEDYEKRKNAQSQQIVSKLKQETDRSDAAVQKNVSFNKNLVEVCESPVHRSLARYLGIDTSLETRRALKLRGIIVIVCGTPQIGKTRAAVALSKYYSAAYLSLDDVVIQAMMQEHNSAGQHARELCAQAACKQKAKESRKTGKKGEAGSHGKKSQPSSGDNVSQKSQSVGQQSTSGKKSASDKSQRKVSLTSKWMTITTSSGEKVECLSCVLPEEVLVNIISERLELNDCYKGVVFDGLETLFASNPTSALLCVLKAVSNRPHIYAVNIFQDYAVWKGNLIAEKERQAAEKERKAREQEQAAKREEERLWNVDEDEYDALPEEKKILLHKRIRQVQRERKERELEKLAGGLEESEGQSHGQQPSEPQCQETKCQEEPTEKEMILDLRFNTCESSQKKVKRILATWDRVNSTADLSLNHEEDTSTKQKGQRKGSLEKSEKAAPEKHRGRKNSKSSQMEEEVAEVSVSSQDTGVPCLNIHVTGPDDLFRIILDSNKLPPAEQILDSMGLGPSGPPIPPGAIFSVVPYPRKRDIPTAEDLKHFILLEPECAAEGDNVPAADASSAKGRSKKRISTGRRTSVKEKRSSVQSTKSLHDSPTEASASSAEGKRSRGQSDSGLEKPARLKRYRWIVPAHGEVEMKIHFSTTVPGKFEQMMNFEILGSKRLYQLPCSGSGLYPSINQNPRLVFPHCIKSKEKDDIIFKEYVLSTKQFHFGPLLCGKSREWLKAQNSPGNCENITILNNSPMEVEVNFSFEHDGRAETFLLDPPSMSLKPKEKQKLTLWAYPTSAGFLEDNLICCIADNPEPVVFQLCCEGVYVKLGVSPKELCFGKLLLHRSDSQTLVLINDSPLPMAWQFSGVDDLGEEFSISQDRGVVGPRTNLEVQLNFTAKKIGISNKMIRLEVSDTENILGIVHAEEIKISVEVYDVNLNINLPKGQDGSLEFGIINVLDKKKEVLSLKNKGTYDIAYSFKLKTGGAKIRNLESHFTIQPQTGVLKASKPPVNIEVHFHPKTELFLKSKPILLCEVTDTNLGEGSKPVATIPLSVSAKAVFSKYSIQPDSPIDFGALMKGTKKSQVIILENKGTLSFKYFIHQAPSLEEKSSQQEESTPAVRPRKHSTQAQLTLGMFTVSPCSGSVAPWGQQKITVDCNAGPEGKCEEHLSIDVCGRDPKDHPLGFPFTLTAESCTPALVEDITSIFEQYPIYTSAKLRRKLQSVQGNGVFVKDANKFVFTKVLIGQQATAQFKISNGSCLPCDVALSIKTTPGMPSSGTSKIFKLHPAKMSIPGSSHAFCTVTFSPQQEQEYECTFTASLVLPKSSPLKVKPPPLTFTISGQGNKPYVTVVHPELQSKSGNRVLRFRRLLVGESQQLPLVISNTGTLPAQFTLHVVDENGAFFMKGRRSALEHFHIEDTEEGSGGKAKKAQKKAYLLLQHGQSAEFDVFFKPTLAQRLEGKVHVIVAGNYEDTYIELVGEGYDDEFTLDNLPGQRQHSEESDAKDHLDSDIIEAVRVNHIQFGECAVGRNYHQTFTITNRSKGEVMRFEWLADAPFQFSPKVGHLQPGCAKDIRVTLKSDVPVTLKRQPVTCKVAKIKYELPPEEVYDWDDTMSTEEWVDTTKKHPGAKWPLKEKVTKALVEPPHTLLEESSHEAELFLSAIIDYAKFRLSTIVVQFEETRLFQSRIGIFKMYNTGNVALKFSWDAAVDTTKTSRCSVKPFSSTLMSYFLSSAAVKLWFKHHQARQPHSGQHCAEQLHDRQSISSSLELSPDAINTPALFSIEPQSGTIPTGKSQIFQVTFCPTNVGNFKSQMRCRISNLEPSRKTPRVIVIGSGFIRKAGVEGSELSTRDGTRSTKPQKNVHWAPMLE